VSRIRRGGYVFQTWIVDHNPRHVHVYDGNRLVVKWDLEGWKPLEGTANRRILRLIRELVKEGRL
jgi:hypothetical protein